MSDCAELKKELQGLRGDINTRLKGVEGRIKKLEDDVNNLKNGKKTLQDGKTDLTVINARLDKIERYINIADGAAKLLSDGIKKFFRIG